MSQVVEKFLKYVKFDTKSSDETGTTPSTKGQLVLGEELVKELKSIGLKDASMDDKGYIMATLLSNIDKEVTKIGFIAHMDTAPDYSGTNVNPQFVENYDGKDIVLNKEDNTILSPKEFPELKDYVGKTLITTDGTTLLGADDKAGIAEIITAMEYLINHPEVKHGEIKIGFTPDEEIGAGADYFDVKKFGAEVAYTLDGGAIGELEYENFNAASAKVVFHGRNVHPGSAKDKMINTMLIANEFIAKQPKEETPERTCGYEGFYLLIDIKGSVEKTQLSYIVRDFDMGSFEKRKATIKQWADEINEKFGAGTCEIKLKDQYFNMKEKVEPVKYVVDLAFNAMEAVGVKPLVKPIRGGTDGARLSFMGLPCPNLFTGGENFHGKYEYVAVESMEKAVEVVLKIVQLYAER